MKSIYLYENPFIQRKEICKDLKNKAGIYMWTNTINNKKYLGSSINLPNRLGDYLKVSFLKTEVKKNKSLIYKALLKYNYDNFKLEILELCDNAIIIEREQYYLNKLELKYNTLKIARSLLGFKHTQASKDKMRIQNLGKPYRGNRENLYSGDRSIPLIAKEIKNEDNIIHFSSIRRAALYLNISPGYISRCLKKNKYYKGRNYYLILNSKT